MNMNNSYYEGMINNNNRAKVNDNIIDDNKIMKKIILVKIIMNSIE